MTATFLEELVFHNIPIQKRYYFTATIPFHGNISYLVIK